MKNVRNVAILLLVALAVAVVPGGDNASAALIAAILIGFGAAILIAGRRAWERQSFFLDSLAERSRTELFGAAGVIALMIAGADELQETGLGTVIWLTLLAGSGYVIYNVIRSAQEY